MLLALLLAASASQAPSVAVLKFRSKLPAAERASVDADYFANAARGAILRAVPTARVMTDENMQVLLKAQGKSLEECEGECEVETGRRLSADYVVSGDLLRLGKRLKLDLRLHDTQEGRLLSAAQASGKDVDELDDATAKAVATLVAPLAQPAKPAEPETDAQRLQRACDAGNVQPCRELAGIYHDGKGVPKDLPRAVALTTRACELGDAVSCLAAGWQHGDSGFVPKDLPRALGYYEKGCGAGEELAKPGHDFAYDWACEILGLYLVDGRAGKRDVARGLALIEKSCNAQYGRACALLGRLYEAGGAVPKDEVRAGAAFVKACDALREPQACDKAAGAFWNGKGAPQSYQESIARSLRACDAGILHSCLGAAHAIGDSTKVPQDHARAAVLYQKACGDGAPVLQPNHDFAFDWGCDILATYYLRGSGVPRDVTRAVALYEKVCAGGYGRACFNLAKVYADGNGVAKDAARAKALYQQACKSPREPWGCKESQAAP